MSKDMKKIVGELLDVTNERIEALAQLIKDHESSGAPLKRAAPKKKAKGPAAGADGEAEGGLDAVQTGDVVVLQATDESVAGLLLGDRAAGNCGVQMQSERDVRIAQS